MLGKVLGMVGEEILRPDYIGTQNDKSECSLRMTWRELRLPRRPSTEGLLAMTGGPGILRQAQNERRKRFRMILGGLDRVNNRCDNAIWGAAHKKCKGGS